MERFMVYGCILGSIGHFIFFGVLSLLVIPGYIIYLIAHLFTKEPMYVFQWGSSVSYKVFFFITPKIVLKKYFQTSTTLKLLNLEPL